MSVKTIVLLGVFFILQISARATIGGAPVAAIGGAPAVNYNVAGLVRGPQKMVTLGITPMVSSGEAPFGVSNHQVEADDTVIVPYSIYGKLALNEKLSLGVGYFFQSGSFIDYGEVDLSHVNSNLNDLKPRSRIKIQFYDLVYALSYQLNKNWNFGLGHRITNTRYQLGGVSSSNTSTVNLIIDDASHWNWAGATAGVQYLADSGLWGLGASYKTEVKFKTKGGSSGSYELAVPGQGKNPLSGGGMIKAIGYNPSELTVGFFKVFGRGYVLWGQYTWLDFSVAREEAYRGDPLTLLGTNILDTPTEQNWQDQHIFDLGGEIPLSPTFKLRSQVGVGTRFVSKTNIQPTYFPPAPMYFASAGFGKIWTQLGFSLDMGAIYLSSSAKNVEYKTGVQGNVKRKIHGMYAMLSWVL